MLEHRRIRRPLHCRSYLKGIQNEKKLVLKTMSGVIGIDLGLKGRIRW